MLKYSDFVFESIYGGYATVYHRTTVSNLVNKVYDEGFMPNRVGLLGSGLYATYDLESQFDFTLDNYGSTIVKFAVDVSNFLFCDFYEFKKQYAAKQVKDLDQYTFIIAQLKSHNVPTQLINQIEKSLINSDSSNEIAHAIYEIIPNLSEYFTGVIYTSPGFGKTLVCYYPNNLAIPISYALDVNSDSNINNVSFIKADKNLNYLRNLLKRKETPYGLSPIGLLFKYTSVNKHEFIMNENGEFLIRGDVSFTRAAVKLKKLPFKILSVDGSFIFSPNWRGEINALESTEGFPSIITETLQIDWCPNLTNIETKFQKIGRDIKVDNCGISSLSWIPKNYSGGLIEITNCKLTNLKQIKSLSNLQVLDVSGNSIKTLEGSPSVSYKFNVSNNKLTSLKYSPANLQHFVYSDNPIKDYNGFPEL